MSGLKLDEVSHMGHILSNLDDKQNIPSYQNMNCKANNHAVVCKFSSLGPL